MLETSSLARKYTHVYSFKKYTFQYQGPLNFADVSIFYKKQRFLTKILPLLKAIVRELCYRCFSPAFSFCKIKVTNNENISFTDYVSGLFFVSFVKFSYRSKFHVNIITCSRVMIISFYKALTRNPEIGKPPPDFCPISGDWREL